MKTAAAKDLFIKPWAPSSRDDCVWYHSFDLPGGESIVGDWDMRNLFDRYIGHVDLTGKRVIDFGTANGFLSFEAERAGAEVVSFDADSTQRYTRLPHASARYASDPQTVIVEDNRWLDGVKRGYWYVHRALQSKNKVVYGDIYNQPAGLGPFDVAILGQFLVHNRSGIDVLEAVSRATTDYMIITEGIWKIDEPGAKLIGSAKSPDDLYSNWIYSPQFYYEVMGMLGFKCEKFSVETFRCHNAQIAAEVELGVFVFRRQVVRGPA